MIALDTNIIIRFLVKDDEKQARMVYSYFKRAEEQREVLFVSLLVVLEVVWVLESAYNMSRTDIINSFSSLRQMPILEFENDIVLEKFILSGEKCATDLSDLLIGFSAQSSDCETVLTFDRKASKSPLFQQIS